MQLCGMWIAYRTTGREDMLSELVSRSGFINPKEITGGDYKSPSSKKSPSSNNFICCYAACGSHIGLQDARIYYPG